jgi:hypothetical protein
MDFWPENPALGVEKWISIFFRARKPFLPVVCSGKQKPAYLHPRKFPPSRGVPCPLFTRPEHPPIHNPSSINIFLGGGGSLSLFGSTWLRLRKPRPINTSTLCGTSVGLIQVRPRGILYLQSVPYCTCGGFQKRRRLHLGLGSGG